MKQKFTPGPWAVHERFSIVIVPLDHGYRLLGASGDEERDKERYALPIAETCYDVCSGFAHERTREEAQANARLIAAAPELLEACEAAQTLIEDMARFVGKMSLKSYALFNETPIALKRAIDKAIGRK